MSFLGCRFFFTQKRREGIRVKKFRLPPGLGDELDEQLSIENKVSFWMIKRLHERGFSQIKTPLLEYFELFEDYRMPNQKMYRLGARG